MKTNIDIRLNLSWLKLCWDKSGISYDNLKNHYKFIKKPINKEFKNEYKIEKIKNFNLN